MKAKHYDIVIDDPKNPFKNCKLGRQQYAEVLTNVVQTYSKGFVLALNNEWGTGKTTFVKMWEQQLKNEGFKTLYFNAWENDFEQNVLVALISELKELKEPKSATAFKSVVKHAAPLAKSIIPILLKSLATKYIGKEGIKEILDATIDVSVEGLTEELKSYTERKKGVQTFKKSLEEFVKKTADDKPVVFIIDELDRCRPNYAVEVLEQIKHLFSVPGIVFVLSIDKEQLGNAVRGVYGSDLINADEYLRRFIDIEYSIPEPDRLSFCKYLYQYFHFDEFISSDIRMKIAELKKERDNIIIYSSLLFEIGKINLRLQEKIFAHARLVIKSFKTNNLVIPELLILLIYLKFTDYSFYKSINYLSLLPQEIIDKLEEKLPQGLTQNQISSLIYVESILLQLYVNTANKSLFNKFQLTRYVESETEIMFKSILDQSEKGDRFKNVLKQFSYNNYDVIGIEYLLDKINLFEAINI